MKYKYINSFFSLSQEIINRNITRLISIITQNIIIDLKFKNIIIVIKYIGKTIILDWYRFIQDFDLKL